MGEVTIKQGKNPIKKPPRQKRIWWRVLLAFFGGFLAFPLTVAGGVAIVGTVMKVGDVVKMTGANPDDILTEEYQQMTMLNAVMDIVNKGITNLEDVEKITPLAENLVYAKLVETLSGYGVAVDQDGNFAIDWDVLKTKDFATEGENAIVPYLLSGLLTGTYASVLLEANDVDLGVYYPLLKYILYDVVRDEDGNPIMDEHGLYQVDLTHPFAIDQVIAQDGPIQHVANYVTLGEIATVLGQEPTGILAALQDWHVADFNSDKFGQLQLGVIFEAVGIPTTGLVGAIADWRINEINQDKFMGLKLVEILGEDTVNNNPILKSINEMFEGGASINDLTMLDQDKLMDFKLVDLLGEETISGNKLLNAINEMFDGQARIRDLMNEGTIYELTIGDVIGGSSTNPIIAALSDTPIGGLQQKINTITLGELIGNSGGALFSNESIRSVKISQLDNLTDILKTQLTLGDLMNINMSDPSTPEILKKLQNTVLQSDPMNPKTDLSGVYTVPFCALDAPDPDVQEFKEWRIGSTTGEVVHPNDEILLTSDITLYPMWQESRLISDPTYTISFNKGEGTGTMEAITEYYGSYSLPKCGFTAPEGKQFKCWTYDDSDMTHIENLNYKDTIEVTDDTGDITLTAVYEAVPQKITINFNNGGGTGSRLSRKVYGTYILPDCYFTAPSGKRFSHWEISENGGTTYTSLAGKYVIRITNTSEDAEYILRAVWETIPTSTHTVSFARNGGSEKEDIQKRIKNIQLKDMMSIPVDSRILNALADTYPLIGDDPEDGKTSLNEKVQTLRLKDIVDIEIKKFVLDETVTSAVTYDSELASKGSLYVRTTATVGTYDRDTVYYSLNSETDKYEANEDVCDTASYNAAVPGGLYYFTKASGYVGGTDYFYAEGDDASAIMIALRNCYPMLTTSVGEKESLNDAVARLKNSLKLKDVFDESNVGSEGILRTLWDSTDGGDFPICDIAAAIGGGTGVSGRVYEGVSFMSFLGDSMYEKDGGGDFITKDIDTAWTTESDTKTYKKINATWWYLLVPGDSTTKDFYEAHPEEKYFITPPSADYKLTSSSLSALVDNMKAHMENDSILDLCDAGFITLDASAKSKMDGIYDGKNLGERNVTDFVSTVLDHLQDVVYTVKFVANGGTGTMTDLSGTLTTLAMTKVPNCTYGSPDGIKVFAGWYIYNTYTEKYYNLSGTASDNPTLIVPDSIKMFGTSVIGGGYQLIAQWA